MKFDVRDYIDGSVRFTAEIDSAEGCNSRSVQLSQAVEWAIRNGISLKGLDLEGVNFSGADLRRVDLEGCNLKGANLFRADAALASFAESNLTDANFICARMSKVNMDNAEIKGADFLDAHGLNDYVKFIQIDTYSIAYTSEDLQIERHKYSIEEWRCFSNDDIYNIGGDELLEFWNKYKEWIFSTIKLSPAKPTAKDTRR